MESAEAGRRLPLIFSTAGIALAADFASKLLVDHSLKLNERPIPILGDVARLTYIHNSGAAFGLFHGSRWFFIAVSVLSLLIVLALALGGRYRDKGMQVAFGMIMGGAAGNLVDRVWRGEVIDFLDLGIGAHRWPVFNVADCAVTIGVILLALRLLSDGRSGRQEVGPQTDTSMPGASRSAEGAMPGASRSAEGAMPGASRSAERTAPGEGARREIGPDARGEMDTRHGG